jgi:hypothetical protein
VQAVHGVSWRLRRVGATNRTFSGAANLVGASRPAATTRILRAMTTRQRRAVAGEQRPVAEPEPVVVVDYQAEMVRIARLQLEDQLQTSRRVYTFFCFWYTVFWLSVVVGILAVLILKFGDM